MFVLSIYFLRFGGPAQNYMIFAQSYMNLENPMTKEETGESQIWEPNET